MITRPPKCSPSSSATLLFALPRDADARTDTAKASAAIFRIVSLFASARTFALMRNSARDTLVSAYKFPIRERVPRHFLFHLFLRASNRKWQFNVKRVDLEVIAMHAFPGARSPVPKTAPAVFPLHTAWFLPRRNGLERFALRGNIKQNPVVPRSSLRIGVIHNKRERLCVLGNIGNIKRRRYIFSVTGKARRNTCATCKFAARYGHSRNVFENIRSHGLCKHNIRSGKN